MGKKFEKVKVIRVDEMPNISSKRLKIAGLALLFIPLGVLALFAAGEVSGGDIGGLSHLAQAAPVGLIALFGWKRPRAGGWTLLAAAVALGTVYALSAAKHGLSALFIAEAMLFLPAGAAGILFIAAGKARR